MTRKSTAALFVFFICVFVPLATNAETVLRISDSISLDDDQTVDGDFYGVAGIAGPVSLSGTIKGDAIAIGSGVTTNGSIEGDLFALGGTSNVHASVTDDVRIIAGEVTIAEHVGGDVFVLGGILTVLSSANIDGNVFFYGGEGEINGRVGGSVFGTSEMLRIDGPVGGTVDVRVARSLVIGDRADIGGDIRYESSNELTRAQNAVVVGDVVRNTPQAKSADPRGALVPILIYTFATLIVYALFRNQLQSLLSGSVTAFTRNGLIGIAGLLLLPVVVSILFLTVIGALVGVLGLLATLFLYLLSFVMSSLLAGILLQRMFRTRAELDLLWTLLGVFAITALFFIPFIGPALILVLMSVVLGTLLVSLYERFFA